jgi:hypothetical protein
MSSLQIGLVPIHTMFTFHRMKAVKPLVDD